MAKKVNKINTASIMKAMELVEQKTAELIVGSGDSQVIISVKKRLSLYERSDMVESIASMVWAQGDDDAVVFAPYLREFAYKFNIINYFTNINLPAKIDNVWEFIDGTDIVERVVDVVGGGYIEHIIREADEAIEYKKAELMKRSRLDSVLDALLGVAKAADQKVDSMDVGRLIEFASQNNPELKEGLAAIFKAKSETVDSNQNTNNA